jgi:hypothetical protein
MISFPSRKADPDQIQGNDSIIEKPVVQSSAFLLDSSQKKPLYFQRLHTRQADDGFLYARIRPAIS